MCTATYFRSEENRIVFTTNRDEHAARPTIPPKVHDLGGLKVLFPKDELAGGSWVAVAENGLICCLMNGAEGEYDWRSTEAKKSRGQVLLDSLFFKETTEFIKNRSFEDVHPFTLLRISPGKDNIEAVKWNGFKSWIEVFNADKAQNWSAFTLYPHELRKERENRFNDWAKQQQKINAHSVWELHQLAKEKNGLLLRNNEAVNTVSTTQLILDEAKCTMIYDEIKSPVYQKKTLDIKS